MFDLYESKALPTPRDQIDFAERSPMPTRQDAITVQQQKHGSGHLGPAAGSLPRRTLGIRPDRLPDHLALSRARFNASANS